MERPQGCSASDSRTRRARERQTADGAVRGRPKGEERHARGEVDPDLPVSRTERLLGLDLIDRSNSALKASPARLGPPMAREARKESKQLALQRMAIMGMYPVLDGALDATLIEDSIGIRALCAECIIRITGLPRSRLNDALPRLIGALTVASILAACSSCLRQRVVHRKE